MATNTSSKRPATMLRCGNIKATIWQNVSEKVSFFATTFSRPFKDQSSVTHNGTSFGLNDLQTLMNDALEAKKWITAQNGTLTQNYPITAPVGKQFHFLCGCRYGSCSARKMYASFSPANLIEKSFTKEQNKAPV